MIKSSWREECGVFGIWNHPKAAELSYLGLLAMQHRGQESAGLVSTDGQDLHVHKGLGLVQDVFSQFPWESQLKGRGAIGHVRYSTTGQNLLVNAQPLRADVRGRPLALAHNGNLVNSKELREQLQKQGSLFQGTSDTEIFLHLLSKIGGDTWTENLPQAVEWVQGAYSVVWLGVDRLVAMRDPMGFRPLVLGSLDGAFVVASETCAFDLIGAQYVREIEPGEILVIDDRGLHSKRFKSGMKRASCVFELIYFSRSDSRVFGKSVYEARKKFGERLAIESPAQADMVIPVPDSGVAAALGFSHASGLPFEWGITRNNYVGRTFIQPLQGSRDFGVKIKLNPQSALLRGKRVVVIDDSLVRGTTSKKIVQLLREAGAREVHLRIASPATISPCYYGVDTPEKDQLIASKKSVQEICEFVGADSLAYLSLEGLFQSLAEKKETFCAACFNEDYPTRVKA